MHFSGTVLAALAAYASGVAAAPAPGVQFIRQLLNTTSTTSTSSLSTDTSSTVLPTTSSSSLLTTSSSLLPSTSSSLLPTTSSSASSSAPPTTSSATSVTPSVTSSSSTSTSATTSASASAIAVQGGTYSTVGCFTDPNNTGFPLNSATKVSTSSTAAQCLNLCANTGIGGPFTYAGVEGTECFCANSYDQSTPQSPGSCGANQKMKRQTGNAITLYQFTPSTSSTTSATTQAITSATTSGTSTFITTELTTLQSTEVSTAPPSSTTSSSSTSPTSSASTMTTSTSTSATTYPTPPPGYNTYTVQPGDTLSGIASRFGVSLSALEAANPQITNPNELEIGQVINLPNSGNIYPPPPPPPTPFPFPFPPPPPNPNPAFVYTVSPGDTLAGIASELGISVAALEAANPQLTNPNVIFPGEVINLPNGRSNTFAYTIAPGDTLAAIAAEFGITLGALEAANGQITNANVIFPGEVISVPRG